MRGEDKKGGVKAEGVKLGWREKSGRAGKKWKEKEKGRGE